MKIIDQKKIDNCLEGENVWEILFDNHITQSFVGHLSQLGKLIIHEFKPKPFYILIVRGKFTLKGAIGNRSARLLLADSTKEDNLFDFFQHIEKFSI